VRVGRIKLFILAALAAVAVALAAALVSAAVAADPPAPVGMAVSVTKAKRSCFPDTFVVTGAVVPKREVLVRPEDEGLKITQILVEAGDTVTASQVLARLAPGNGQPGPSIAVRALAGGIVSAAPTVVGAMTSARGDPLFRIIVDGDVELSAEIPAKQAPRLATGQAAKVRIAGLEDSRGQVQLVSTIVDPNSQLAPLRISLERNPLLRVGAFGRATIEVGQSCGVAIPLSAVLHGPAGAVAQAVRDDRIETRQVTIGLLAEGMAEIRQGLAEGDTIVVRAGAFLQEGDRVRPVEDGEASGK